MEEGYVYILYNKSLGGMLKIGSTTFGAEKRAKQLSHAAGVPTPFMVAYEVYVRHYEELEKAVHNKLAKYRVNPRREFFKVSIDKAIEVINHEKENPYYNSSDKYTAIEILPKLVSKYGDYIDPAIVSAKIYQEIDRVYFEYTKYNYTAGYLKDQVINRLDLGFIVYDTYDDNLFKAEDPTETNAKKFLELDDTSMANCVGDIFTEEWFHI